MSSLGTLPQLNRIKPSPLSVVSITSLHMPTITLHTLLPLAWYVYPTGTQGTVTVEKLAEMYCISSDQLNCEIEEVDTTILAGYFDDVEYYLNVLGLSPAEQTDIRTKAITNGTQVAMNYCLLLWRQHNPFSATLRTLLKMLLSLRKEEIAKKVCNYYCPKYRRSD